MPQIHIQGHPEPAYYGVYLRICIIIQRNGETIKPTCLTGWRVQGSQV